MLHTSTPAENAPAFGLIIPVADGERSLLRASDSIESLAATVSGLSNIIIVDDSRCHLRTFTFGLSAAVQTRVVPAPRNGDGDGWKGGLACSILTVLGDLPTGVDWWIKCDDDSVGVCSLATSRLPRSSERAVLGSIEREFDGRVRDLRPIERYISAAVRRESPSARDVTPLDATRAPGRAYRSVLSDLLAAAGRGYGTFARHCHGGGYLFSGAAAASLRHSGIPRTAEVWLAGDLGEDVIVSCAFAAAGASLVEASSYGVALAIARRSLPASPAALVTGGTWLAHSTRGRSAIQETKVRRFFRLARESVPVLR